MCSSDECYANAMLMVFGRSYLQTEVRAFNCRSLLQRVPLFADAGERCWLSYESVDIRIFVNVR
jgi:hypothetical protein